MIALFSIMTVISFPHVVVPGDELDEVVVLGISSFFRYADW